MAGGDAPLGKKKKEKAFCGVCVGISVLGDPRSSPGEGPELPDVLGGWLCFEQRLRPRSLPTSVNL